MAESGSTEARAMESWRAALAECREELVKNMYLPPVLVELMTGSPPTISQWNYEIIEHVYLTEFQRVDKFLDIMNRLPLDAIHKFHAALENTNQRHLSEMLRKTEARHRERLSGMGQSAAASDQTPPVAKTSRESLGLKPSEQSALIACRSYLAKEMELDYVLLHLKHRMVIDDDQYDQIKFFMESSTPWRAVDALLTVIRKSARTAFEALLNALDDTHQTHLAYVLREREGSHASRLSMESKLIALSDKVELETGTSKETKPVPKEPVEKKLETVQPMELTLTVEQAAALKNLFLASEENIRLRAQLEESEAQLERHTLASARDRKEAQDAATIAGARIEDLVKENLGLIQQLAQAHTKARDSDASTNGQMPQEPKIEVSQQMRQNESADMDTSPTLKRVMVIGGNDREHLFEVFWSCYGPRKLLEIQMGLRALSCAHLPISNRCLIVGGEDENGNESSLCFYVDKNSLEVTVAPELPQTMTYHAMTTLGDSVFLTHFEHCCTFRYGVWGAFSQMGTPRFNHSSATDGSVMAVFGGYNVCPIASVEVYCPGDDTWKRGPELTHATMGLRAVYLYGRYYVVGGEDGVETFATVEAWDPRTTAWDNLKPMGKGRTDHGLLAIQGQLFAFGGEDDDTIEVYDPRANRWTNSEVRLSKPGSAFGFCEI